MTTDYSQRLKRILADILCLDTSCFVEQTPLLGSIPELDSVAVMNLIMELESKLDFNIQDVDLSAETFSTFGTLLQALKDHRIKAA